MTSQHASVVDEPVANAVRPFWLGFDVGGTNIKIGLVDDLGRPLGKTSIPSEPNRQPQGTIQRMVVAATELIERTGSSWDEIPRVGLGTPGTMDIPGGLMLEPPNMPGWHHFPVRDRLSEACGKRVVFANDANAAAFGEFWVGSGRNFPSIVLLTLGTGVGGGIIVDGLSIDGENSCGSECGHIIIDYHDTARMCNCGQRGHLEAYASATALMKRCDEAIATGRASRLTLRAAAGEKITPIVIGEEAELGDSLALELVLDTAYYLGIGITSLMHTIDPAAVILAGAMNFGGHDRPLGRKFIERIRAEVRLRAFPVLAERTTIDFAQLGGDAGFIGAAGIARAAVRPAAGSTAPT